MVGILARLKVQKYRAIASSRNYSAKYFSSQQPESPRPTINQEVQAVQCGGGGGGGGGGAPPQTL